MSKRLFQPSGAIDEILALPFKTRTLGKSRGALRAALYALHRCHLAPYTTDSVWASLPSQMMGKIAGGMNIWAKVRKLLCDNGFLECDGKSKHGVKCFSYRLGPKLHDAEWRGVAVAEETRKGRIAKARELAAAPLAYSEIGWTPLPHELPTPTDDRPAIPGLSLDKDKAHQILSQIASDRGWTRRTLEAWHARIEDFSSAYHVGTTGRIFTDGNMLPKEVREALLIDGETTVEIDVKNCHPLLLATIYQTPSEESARWKALCESGRTYEEFMAKFTLSREAAKHEQLLPFFYGGKRPMAEQFLSENFPELLERITSFPRNGPKSLAHVLQRMESDIIVEAVCGAFRALSVHDAVRVKASDELAATRIIQDLFYERHGLRPILDAAA